MQIRLSYIYRIHNGRKQRRRWNYTQGEWYDKKWEDVGTSLEYIFVENYSK